MTEILKKISVDLSRRGNTRLIFARQNDQGSRRVSIKLTDCGKPYFVPKSTVATINILRSDGASAAFSADVTDSGNVEFTLGLWALSVSGEARCSVSLYDKDSKLTSADFTLDVLDTLYQGDGISEDTEYTLLTSLLSEMAGFKEDEEARAEAEKDREDAEEYRALGEAQRNRNESLRFAAEETRQAAEDARALAEAEREAAEQRRETEFAKQKNASNINVADEGGRFVSNDVEGALGEIADSLEAQQETMAGLKTRVDSLGGDFGKLTLKIDDFDAGLVAEAEIADAGECDLISFYPESAADADIAAGSGLFILPNAAYGKVMFTAKTLPSADLNFCYFITRGGTEND